MKKISYLNHIDALRAIAVLLVILFHLDVELFKGGFIGVDVFFVISGFLITRILKNEFYETGKINFKSFYIKRLKRLIPTLYLTIFLTFVLTFLTFSPFDFMSATSSMFKSSIALSNFHFLSESDYFASSSNFKPLLHTWSLGIEEQFYLIFPITLFLLMRIFNKKKNGVFLSLLFLFFISLFYTCFTSKFGISKTIHDLFLPKNDIIGGVPSMQFFLLPFRMFEFLIGSILGYERLKNITSEYSKLYLNVLGLFLIVTSSILLSEGVAYLSVLNILPCIGTGVLLYFPPSKYLSFLFNNKGLKYIGKISYTVYLIHWVVIVIYRYTSGRGDFSQLDKIGMLVVMFLISSIIYKYYEMPLRYSKSKFSLKSNFSTVLFLVMGAISIYGIKEVVNKSNGFLWRLSDEKREFVEKIGVDRMKDFKRITNGCYGYRSGWLGGNNKKNAVPDLIWTGDSHAGHYLAGVDSILVKESKVNVYNLYSFSSVKLPDLVVSKNENAIKRSKHSFEVLTKLMMEYPRSPVVLSHFWNKQINRCKVYNHDTDKYEKIPEGTPGWEILADKIVEFHNNTGVSRQFVIIGESPETKNYKLNYINKLLQPKYLSGTIFMHNVESEFSQNHIEFNSFFENYFSSIENISFINPSDALCKDRICQKRYKSKIFYSDGDHLSKDGAIKVISHVRNDLLEIINKN